mgnify:CR=1 FL=1
MHEFDYLSPWDQNKHGSTELRGFLLGINVNTYNTLNYSSILPYKVWVFCYLFLSMNCRFLILFLLSNSQAEIKNTVVYLHKKKIVYVFCNGCLWERQELKYKYTEKINIKKVLWYGYCHHWSDIGRFTVLTSWPTTIRLPFTKTPAQNINNYA